MKNKILILLLMMLIVFYPNKTLASISTSTGSTLTKISATTITSGQNITWDLSGTVTIAGTVTINSGGKLNLTGSGTISRASGFTGSWFNCAAGGTLIINGDTQHSIIFDGVNTLQAAATIVCLGNVTVENANIKNFLSETTGHSVFSLTPDTTGETNIKNCIVESCDSATGSVMYLKGAGNAKIKIYRTIFQNNDSTTQNGGGCIGTEGSGKWQMTIEESVFRNNYGGRLGGAIRWNANGDGCNLVIKNCQFLNNWVGGTAANGNAVSTANGGALFYEGNTGSIIGTEGTITEALDSNTDFIPESGIVGTLFKGNEVIASTAAANKTGYAGTGGAICISSYGASSGVGDGRKCELDLIGNILIQENQAANGGGGISLNVTNSAYLGENYPFSLTISEGVCIKNNSAKWAGIINPADEGDEYAKGGGIFINNEPEAKLLASVTIAGGVVQNNTTMGGTKDGKGGDIYVRNGTFIMTSGTVGGNDTTVTAIDGGAVYVNEGAVTFSGGTISKGVASGNGGAIYLTTGNFTMSGGSIEQCTAAQNGGAIYVSGGDFTINGGNIGRINGNTKLGSKAIHGGAAYISGGNFTMNGGTIEGNIATESGGAIQISNGNVYITDGKISSNVARGESATKADDVGYGGGIFVDGGDTVKIDGGEISNNVAAKNGGGIEVKTSKTVTVDVYSGSFIENVAEGCGGAVGIECDNGTINVGKKDCDGSVVSSHEHPVILENIAGIQGGGFYMSGANAKLNIYCGYVDDNTVGEVENNFDQSNGIVTIYEGGKIGTSNEGIIIVGGSFIDERVESEEMLTITYYSNYNGDAEFKKASITKGALITVPGNIFGIQDYTVLGWTKDQSNTTEIEYIAGDFLTLSENITVYALWVLEEENVPSFMIIIPAELTFTRDTDTIFFDVEATLNLFPRNKMLNIRLHESDFTLKLYNNGNISDTIVYSVKKDEEKIQNNGIVLSAYSDSALITYEVIQELALVLNEKQIQYAGAYEDVLTFSASIEDL